MKRIATIVSVLIYFSSSAQFERLSLVQYNLMWYRASSAPCTHNQNPSNRDNELKTILNYSNPDIFIVNELGANPSNGPFLKDFVLDQNGPRYLQSSYSNNNFSSLTNLMFYDSAKVKLWGQDFIDKDLSGNSLVRGIDVYKLYYKDKKLSQGADTVFFAIITGHLKAGNGTPEALERLDATEAVMDYVENHLSIDNVIFCGDFNVYSNSEPAFQKLINYSDTSENFVDPIQQLGAWNNNSNYAAFHTQSTHSSGSGCYSGGGLDDRFDFILISEELKSGRKNLKFVPNSYLAIGQDGNHFNQSVNNGTNGNVPSSIANALYNFSDHLPVRMQLDVKLSSIGITENPFNRLSFTNPIDRRLALSFGKPFESSVAVQLISITGKVVYAAFAEAGTKKFTITTAALPKGIYILHLRNIEGESIIKKIIKR